MDQTTCHVYIESQRNLAKNTNTICLFCFGKNILDLTGLTENALMGPLGSCQPKMRPLKVPSFETETLQHIFQKNEHYDMNMID